MRALRVTTAGQLAINDDVPALPPAVAGVRPSFAEKAMKKTALRARLRPN
jgi:hypothetical protein